MEIIRTPVAEIGYFESGKRDDSPCYSCTASLTMRVLGMEWSRWLARIESRGW
jgi:hypothetical protein